jgi:hypothetical protein
MTRSQSAEASRIHYELHAAWKLIKSKGSPILGAY